MFLTNRGTSEYYFPYTQIRAVAHIVIDSTINQLGVITIIVCALFEIVSWSSYYDIDNSVMINNDHDSDNDNGDNCIHIYVIYVWMAEPRWMIKPGGWAMGWCWDETKPWLINQKGYYPQIYSDNQSPIPESNSLEVYSSVQTFSFPNIGFNIEWCVSTCLIPSHIPQVMNRSKTIWGRCLGEMV